MKEDLEKLVKDTMNTQPTWDKCFGFRFSDDLTELFNTVSKANALIEKLTEQEYDRWKGYGESPDNYCKDFEDATEYCMKMVNSLSEYAAELVKYEMFEKFKE